KAQAGNVDPLRQGVVRRKAPSRSRYTISFFGGLRHLLNKLSQHRQNLVTDRYAQALYRSLHLRKAGLELLCGERGIGVYDHTKASRFLRVLLKLFSALREGIHQRHALCVEYGHRRAKPRTLIRRSLYGVSDSQE